MAFGVVVPSDSGRWRLAEQTGADADRVVRMGIFEIDAPAVSTPAFPMK
jgi:hypothetical protein